MAGFRETVPPCVMPNLTLRMKPSFLNYSNRQAAAEKNRSHLMLGYILKQKPNATFRKFDPSVLPYGGIFVNVS